MKWINIFLNWLLSLVSSKTEVVPQVKDDSMQSIAQENKVPKYYEIALEYLGETEIPGDKHNAKIVNFFKTVTGQEFPDETSWCAAFTGYCLHSAGLPHTGKLNARSYLDYGTPVESPRVGDIVVFWRESKESWKGHVGFYAGETTTTVKVLGGNQNNMVSIANYSKERLLGYRRP